MDDGLKERSAAVSTTEDLPSVGDGLNDLRDCDGDGDGDGDGGGGGGGGTELIDRRGHGKNS